MAKILEILIEKVKRAQKLAFYFIVCVCVFLHVLCTPVERSEDNL